MPLVVAYDMHELVWLPPMPLLFQRRYGAENRPIPAHAIRKILHAALAAAGLTSASGTPLTFTPHDFRRSVDHRGRSCTACPRISPS